MRGALGCKLAVWMIPLTLAALPAAAQTCPGGTSLVTVASADFTGGFPPAGWAVTNSTTNCVAPGVPNWTNTDPGARTNLTGGAGAFAVADSDACGSSSVMNATLSSPTLSFAGLTNATVIYWTDYNDISSVSDLANLDVSVNGGTTWSNLITWNEDHRGPLQITQALTGADGQAAVRVRWDYVNATWDWWWQVDDVQIRACQPAGCTLTLTCPADQVVAAPPGAQSQIVEFPDPTVGGNCTAVTASCDPASGDLFDLGTTTVVCTAVDAQTGTEATCSFDVTVGAQTIQEIPTLDGAGFAALALLLAALSVAWIRRRRA